MKDLFQKDRLTLLGMYAAPDVLRIGDPGDRRLSLALLARNGMRKWREILARCMALPEPDRRRVMAQREVFSGLRPLPERFKMEWETMRISNDIEKDPILGSLFREMQFQLEAKPRQHDKRLLLLLRLNTLEVVIGKRAASTAKN